MYIYVYIQISGPIALKLFSPNVAVFALLTTQLKSLTSHFFF